MRSIPRSTLLLSLAAVLAGCDFDLSGPDVSTTRVVSTRVSGGRTALLQTISGLRKITAVEAGQSSAHASPTSSNTALGRVLDDLESTLSRWDRAVADRASGKAAVYGSPTPGGSSWIFVKTGLFREVHYHAYTTCIDCYNMDTVHGLMRVRQYAGGVQTLNTDRYYGGGQGYMEGEVVTTISGGTQTGVVYTDHWVDVWLGPDPHITSSASSQL